MCKFPSTDQDLIRQRRRARCVSCDGSVSESLGGPLPTGTAGRSSNGQAAASAVSETVSVWSEKGKRETHLGEEHGKDGQADPVDDAGELECIVNCRQKKNRTTG